jgi:hypothetical protein
MMYITQNLYEALKYSGTMCHTEMAKRPAKKSKASLRITGQDAIRKILKDHGIPAAKHDAVLQAFNDEFDFGRVERIERLVGAILEWFKDNATEGKEYACTMTEAIIAFQHVSYKLFDTMRQTEAQMSLLDLLAQAKHASGTKQTQPSARPPEPDQDQPPPPSSEEGSQPFYR